jgi:hypothetical protein
MQISGVIRICKYCGKKKDISLFRRYDKTHYENTCKDCYNKKRQSIRRIQQLKRYNKKLEMFRDIQSPALLGYAAGIIDGEGCIYISKGKPRGFRLTPQFTLKVAVGMSNLSAVKLLHKAFGGALRKRANKNYKSIYRWELSSVEAECFLRLLRSYLIVKHSEANLGIAFRDHINKYIRKNGRIVEAKELKIRELFKTKMEALKCK